jgi:hypothetical protein
VAKLFREEAIASKHCLLGFEDDDLDIITKLGSE